MRAVQEDAVTETGDAGSRAPSVESPGEMPSPPPVPARWVPHRKAEIVAAVRGGAISLDEACARYALSIEEFLAWQHGIDLFGLAGLRVYKTQRRRRVRTKPQDS